MREEEPVVVPAYVVLTSEGVLTMRFKYTWCIKISYIPDIAIPIKPTWSSVFVPESNQGLKWSVCHFNKRGEEDSVLFKLRLEPDNVCEMDIKCTLTTPKRLLYKHVGEDTFKYGPSDKIKVFELSEATGIDVVEWDPSEPEIECMIELTNFAFNISIIDIPKSEFQDDLERLFKDQKYTDFTFNVSGQEIRVHKNVLSARSSVFKATFEHDMLEKQTNQAHVNDVEPEVFEEMLRYLYTDEVPNVDKMADKLLIAADKYQLVRLKRMCEEKMRTQMTTDNAVDTLMLADHYNAKDLKNRALYFISSSSELDRILETDGFRLLTESRPVLMAEILRSISIKDK